MINLGDIMKKIQLYNDTFAFIFNELIPYDTIIYVILRNNTAIFIDSFLSESYIKEIINSFDNRLKNKELVLINTHYHFDHIWGNQFFKDHKIYAHELCVNKILNSYQNDMFTYEQYLPKNFALTLPNITFKAELNLANLNLTLKHTPGHSNDSITIYDHLNNAIYVGDNLELPLISLDESNLLVYIKTLESYKFNQIHASHTLNINQNDVYDTINYLKNIETISFTDKLKQSIHLENLDFLKYKI